VKFFPGTGLASFLDDQKTTLRPERIDESHPPPDTSDLKADCLDQV